MAASSSQSAASRRAYDVFLSFRGEDTRKNFTDHLYAALRQAGYHAFRDDDEIQRGENIQLELQRAIAESKMAIIVFSRTYASSSWCLDELLMILKHKELHVLPVFYDVDPTHLRKQSGSYATDFVQHEERFDKGKVDEWRAALTEVADLAGEVLGDKYETHFIQEIVQQVDIKLGRRVLHVDPNLVGVDYRVQALNLWLQKGSNHDAKLAIVYGIGGIGKTTIANIVYKMNLNKFQVCSILSDVREKAKQPNGLVQLQRELLSDLLLKRKVDKIRSVGEGIMRIERALFGKKVLLIMDDVDDVDQFNAIISMKKCFHQGSKIIVTTRCENLLEAHEVDEKFKIAELDHDKSLELFSWHVFHQDHPKHGYEKRSEKVVDHCGGLPLALKVLGLSLHGNTTDEWESKLKELEKIVDGEIQKVLRISYDSLANDHDKNLFLDIACFFIGMDEGYVIRILDGCEFCTKIGIKRLVDKGLITVDGRNKLMMHQLIRGMGREIVVQESYANPGKRSRLWDKDAFTVLTENTGTESIRGLNLDISMFMEDNSQGNCSIRHPRSFLSWQPASIAPLNSLSTKAFSKMQELKLLKLICSVKLIGNFEDFPKNLRWLHWHGFPLNSIPNDLCLKKLIVLEMHNSKLRNVWVGIRCLRELKILDLSHSYNLVRTPNFKGVPRLERLVLKDCVHLVEVDESIGDLLGLVSLNLEDCKSLKKLPVNLRRLQSLEELVLTGCVNLVGFESLRVLHANEIAINQMVLSKLWPWFCNSITAWLLPRNITGSINSSFASLPSSLVSLHLQSCGISDDAIPKDLSCLYSLRTLNLRRNPISCIPESIKNLKRLEELRLDFCRRLQSLPEFPRNLKTLSLRFCDSLEAVTIAPSSWFMTMPTILHTGGCKKLVEIPGLFKLEAITDTNLEILHNLGLVSLESIESDEVEVYSACGKTKLKTVNHQVLHEAGIVSMFLPGSKVPDWFNIKEKGSFISFDVLPMVGHKISGFSLCVVYAFRKELFNRFSVTIRNKTKGWWWNYAPRMYGGAKSGKDDILWFSLWYSTDYNLLEESDQVQVLEIEYSSRFDIDIKECGINLICQHEDSGAVQKIRVHNRSITKSKFRNQRAWKDIGDEIMSIPGTGNERARKDQWDELCSRLKEDNRALDYIWDKALSVLYEDVLKNKEAYSRIIGPYNEILTDNH